MSNRKRLLSEKQWALINAGLAARQLVGDAPLAEMADVSLASVSRWRSGANGITDEKLRRIADGLEIPFAKLADPASYPDGDSVTSRQQIGGERRESLAAAGGGGYRGSARERAPVHLEYVYYPILGKANCGPGGGAIYPEGESVAIPRQALQALRVVRAEDLKCIEMAGVCMSPLIADGDFALFDPNTVPQDGEVVCVTWIHDGDEEHIVKRITHLDKEGRVALEPDVAIPGMPGRVELNLHDEGVILEGVLVQVIHNINRPRPPIPTVSYRRAERIVPRAPMEDVG